jgi:hypothetical protein
VKKTWGIPSAEIRERGDAMNRFFWHEDGMEMADDGDWVDAMVAMREVSRLRELIKAFCAAHSWAAPEWKAQPEIKALFLAAQEAPTSPQDARSTPPTRKEAREGGEPGEGG